MTPLRVLALAALALALPFLPAVGWGAVSGGPALVSSAPGAGSADTRVAGIHIRGNLRASAFLIDEGVLRVGGLRRLHVLNPRVPELRVAIRDGSGRVLADAEYPTTLRGDEQWVEIALDPGLGPLTITLSR